MKPGPSAHTMRAHMDQLSFVPSAGEFFLWGDADPGELPAPLLRLRAAGWPSAARIVGGPEDGLHAEGVLLELLDALPILAGVAEDGPGPLGAWGAAARYALGKVRDGRLLPRLVPRHGRDFRITGWEARWTLPCPPSERGHLAALAQQLEPVVVAVPLGRLASEAQLERARGHPAAWLVRRMLDGSADMLVREATWRGAVVRLAGCPADSWEQRLVHALTDVHASFASGDMDAAELQREIAAWDTDQAVEPPLLPSPPAWRAEESLCHAVGRMTAPAALLARELLQSHPAPRTLLRPPIPVVRR